MVFVRLEYDIFYSHYSFGALKKKNLLIFYPILRKILKDMKDEAGVAILRCRPPVKLNFIHLSFSTRQRLQELRMAANDIFQFSRESSFLLRKGSRRTW